ncbi:MAG: prepilin-type N-terminal cleavage/methylation domain-containing protein [Chromatiales bacterium]|nr:prepilin-type N-terminal cleavage/methylation domain-containing protein [Chromatiales bacterium]
MKKMQSGFTLIELIMVIVILGVLAATAAPRFLDLQSDARAAAVDGLAGGLKSAGSITYAACLLDAACDQSAATSSASVGGQSIAVAYGWPTAASIDTAADVTLGNFTAATSGTARTYTLAANCLVTYTEAASAGATATVTVDKSSC